MESYHAMLAATVVAPGHAKIVPLMPEFIAPQDGGRGAPLHLTAHHQIRRWSTLDFLWRGGCAALR
jgi:hypothetical protein